MPLRRVEYQKSRSATNITSLIWRTKIETTPIIEKIKKLLALSNSSNEFEAALAAAHAQRLLSEHNLGMADIEASHKPDKADKIEMETTKTLAKWVRHLSAGVCNAFDCQAVHNATKGILTFIGVGEDAQVAAYTFAYLDRTVRKLCSTYMKSHVSDTITGRKRELRRQSYYLGAVSTITIRLGEQKVRTPVTPGALVPLKETLIKQTMNEFGNVRTMHSRRSYINSDAYSKGQNDGRQVGIHQGVEQSTFMSKGLLDNH
ncbi:MAG: DUF2786 domain-containing protein [Syntrophales bacterium]|nr:DUF2786 domain-containing protein [Syntrophales bacterium]